MIIRKILYSDTRSVAKLLLRELSKPPYNENVSLSAVIKSLRFFLKIGMGFVAIEKNELAGVIYFKVEQFWTGPTMEIEDLVVDETFQGKGVGKKLLQKIEEFAKNKKVVHIILSTSRKAKATGFYKKLGYQQMTNTIVFRKQLK